jgi:AcrR family transcriptional regulator
MPRRMAAAVAGVGHGTFYRWLDNDESFRDACEAAEGRFIDENLQAIGTVAVELKSWRARAWLLERRFPDLFGPHESVELSGSIDQPAAAKAEADLLAEIVEFAAIAGHRVEFDVLPDRPAIDEADDEAADVTEPERARPAIAVADPEDDELPLPPEIAPPDEPEAEAPADLPARTAALGGGWVTVTDDYRRHFGASIAAGMLKTLCGNRYPVEQTGPADAGRPPCSTCRPAG